MRFAWIIPVGPGHHVSPVEVSQTWMEGTPHTIAGSEDQGRVEASKEAASEAQPHRAVSSARLTLGLGYGGVPIPRVRRAWVLFQAS